MMTTHTRCFVKPAIFILILCILAAGCTSTPVVKTVTPTPIPIEYVTKMPTSVPTPQVTLSDDGSKTCSQLQGTVAVPGQVCSGTWLTVSDSFSCCSKKPVAGKSTKSSLAVDPLDLRIAHNDIFVNIGTG